MVELWLLDGVMRPEISAPRGMETHLRQGVRHEDPAPAVRLRRLAYPNGFGGNGLRPSRKKGWPSCCVSSISLAQERRSGGYAQEEVHAGLRSRVATRREPAHIQSTFLQIERDIKIGLALVTKV